jgi:hypothetical protein
MSLLYCIIYAEVNIKEECARGGVNVAGLILGSRRSSVSGVRAVIAHRCAEEMGLPAAEIARQLGVTTSTIIWAIERVIKQGEK